MSGGCPVLIREGGLDELISIDDQTELRVDQLDPAAIEEVRQLIASRGGRVLEVQKPRTTLESYFLDVTRSPEKPS